MRIDIIITPDVDLVELQKMRNRMNKISYEMHLAWLEVELKLANKWRRQFRWLGIRELKSIDELPEDVKRFEPMFQ